MKKVMMAMISSAVLMSTVGCAAETDMVSNEISESASVVASVDVSTGALDSAEVEASDADSEEKSYEKYYEYISPKAREDVAIDAESAALYDAFLVDEAKATFYNNADDGIYICFTEFLEDGGEYSLSEIAESMTGEGQYLEDTGYLGSDVSYIDCGLDGSIEMIVYINLETEFIPTMVIKNVDGNLKICYAYDSWSRSNTEVYYNGVVSSYGSSGADLHGGYTGFIDAAGDYHFWYGETEECFGNRDEDNTLVYYYNEDHIIEGADMLFLESITFDNEEFYYYFYLTDSDYNDVEDASVNGVNPYDTVSDILTEEQGLSLISSTEAQIMIENRRLEIGLSDEVYSYGDEYRPE